MKKLTLIAMALSATILLTISTNSFSKEAGISGRAPAVDKANNKYKVHSEENREIKADRMEEEADRIREAAEKKADKMEDKADRLRESAEKRADRLEERADRIRNASVSRYYDD